MCVCIVCVCMTVCVSVCTCMCGAILNHGMKWNGMDPTNALIHGTNWINKGAFTEVWL